MRRSPSSSRRAGKRLKRDEWKDGSDLVKRESSLFVQGKEKGKMTLRLITDEATKDIPVTVR